MGLCFELSGLRLFRGGGRFRLLPLALHGLGDQAHLDRLGADLDTDNLPIDDRANLLDIGTELAGGDARDLGSDAAQIFRLAAMGNLVAEGGLLTGEITNAWHWIYLKLAKFIEPSIVARGGTNASYWR